MKRKRIIRIVCGVLLLALLIAFTARAGYVLMPNYPAFGSGWNMYRQEPENSLDVLYFGSSLCYCDVAPTAVWEETGLTGFVMGGPEQTPAMTYFYIREALKSQKPSVVCLELSGFCFRRYTNYTKVNVGYMPWSLNRLGATLFAAEPEERLGLFFPLHNYHERWKGFGQLFQPRADEIVDLNAGYTLLTETRAQESRGPRTFSQTEEVFEEHLSWLPRIRDYCEDRGVELVLFQVPSCAWIPEEKLQRIRETAGPTVPVWDFTEDFEAIGLDMETDFYDDLHTNLRGAVKFSAFLGRRLAERYDFAPVACDEALWRQRVDAMHEKLAEMN